MMLSSRPRIALNFEHTTTAVINNPVQVAKIGLLSAATTGWLMASKVTQVIRFIGTRNQLVTVALRSSGISSLLKQPIDGKYSPMAISNTKKLTREIILILSVASGDDVTAVNAMQQPNTTAET